MKNLVTLIGFPWTFPKAQCQPQSWAAHSHTLLCRQTFTFYSCLSFKVTLSTGRSGLSSLSAFISPSNVKRDICPWSFGCFMDLCTCIGVKLVSLGGLVISVTSHCDCVFLHLVHPGYLLAPQQRQVKLGNGKLPSGCCNWFPNASSTWESLS